MGLMAPFSQDIQPPKILILQSCTAGRYTYSKRIKRIAVTQNHPQWTTQQEAQLAWEQESITRGIARYRAAVNKQDPGETGVGQQATREIVLNLAPAIQAKQHADMHLDALQAGGRGSFEKVAAFASLDAVTMAVIVTRSCLSSDERAVASLAVEVGNRCRHQRELELWAEAEAAKVKAAKAVGERAVDLYKLMCDRTKRVDERTYRRWKKKFDAFKRTDWDTSLRAWVGMTLIGMMVEHGGGWFQTEMVGRTKGRRWVTERVIRLTDIAKDWVRQQHRHIEESRPWLVPMICEPKPWVRVQQSQHEDEQW